MDKQILSEFKKFLLDKKFIPEKNTPFYAYWVNKFLYFSNNTEILPADARIKKFLDQLSAKAETTDNIMGSDLTISLFIFPRCLSTFLIITLSILTLLLIIHPILLRFFL